MNDFFCVESHEALEHLPENMPNLILLDEALELLGLVNLALKVTSIRYFHDNAQLIGLLVKKCLFVANDIFVDHRG